jgi:hypothetical protein
MSRKCGSFNVSEPCRPPGFVTLPFLPLPGMHVSPFVDMASLYIVLEVIMKENGIPPTPRMNLNLNRAVVEKWEGPY